MSPLFDSPRFNQSLFFARPDASAPPAGATELFVPVPGATIHLRWHRRPVHQGRAVTLLLFHGNGEVVADYDALAGHFADCGADLAVVDYRGYGQSQGTPTLRNMLADAPLVLTALHHAGAESIVVMGRSLGSGCAAELYPSAPDFVVGFIWESGAADLPNLVRRRGLIPPAAFGEAELAAFDPCRKLARGQRPLLVLHGKEDSLISASEAQQAFAAAATTDKKLCLIAHHGHNDLAQAPLYWHSIRDFVHHLARPFP